MKTLYGFLLLLWATSTSFAQTVTSVEYFIDTDPGYGQATALPVDPNLSEVNLDFSIPLSNLTTGLHRLFIRAKDSNNKWSIVSPYFFYKDSFGSLTSPDIVKVEYFIDTDPGYGQATALPIGSNLPEIDLDFSIPLGSLTPGLHRLFIRTKDSNNSWSIVSNYYFYKDSFGALTLPNIVQVEYFIDTDPGVGNATNIPFTTGTEVHDLDFSIPMTSLTDGPHKLFMRCRNALGNWSIVQTKTFSKQSNGIAVKNFPATWCIGNTINVEYSSTGTFAADNEFKIQISNINGVFPSDYTSQILGSIVSTTPSGSIPITILPNSGIFTGEYKMRAIATNPGVPSATNVFSEEIAVNIEANCPCTSSDLNAAVTITQEIPCTGAASAEILVAATGGKAPYQFRVDGGVWQFDPEFAGLSAGEHVVETRDVNGCTTSDPVEIIFDTSLSIDGDAASIVLPDGVNYNLSGPNCRLIASVQGVGLSNGITPFLAKVAVEDQVKAYNGQPYIQRHFEFTPGGTNPTNATITIYFTKGEIQAFNSASTVKLPVEATDNKDKLRILQWHGDAFVGAPDAVIDPADTDITWDAILEAWKVKFHVTGFSSFFVTAENAGALPVTLVSFRAKKQEDKVLLSWQTTEETNSQHFEVQHSPNGRQWKNLGTVVSSGDSKTLKDYTFIHPDPINGENLYRLKLIDKDGSFAFSRILSIQFNGDDRITIYPNPVSDMVTIDSNFPIVSYNLISINGQVIRQKEQEPIVKFAIPLENIAGGLYILKLTAKTGHSFYKKLTVK